MRESVRTLTLSYLGKMSENEKEPIVTISSTSITAIADAHASFIKNLSSNEARQMSEVQYNIALSVWIDKHYLTRNDEREGIQPDVVDGLVKRSIPYLVAFSNIIKGFSFVNYNKKLGQPRVRVVLAESTDGITLNVPIEVHYIGINKLEITVITAMREKDFYIADGQHFIEFKSQSCQLGKLHNKQKQVLLKINV
jgi:hypothetical protein